MQLYGNDIQDPESTMDGYMAQYLQMIERKIETAHNKTTDLDLSATIPLLTLDMIAHLCLGESFGSIQHETDTFDFFTALNLGMLFQQYIAVLPEITTVLLGVGKLPWLRTRLFPKGSNSNGIGRVMLVSRPPQELTLEQLLNKPLESPRSRGEKMHRARKRRVQERHARFLSLARSFCRPSHKRSTHHHVCLTTRPNHWLSLLFLQNQWRGCDVLRNSSRHQVYCG